MILLRYNNDDISDDDNNDDAKFPGFNLCTRQFRLIAFKIKIKNEKSNFATSMKAPRYVAIDN